MTSAPTSPGVYFFLGDGDEVLYVGKAANLRRRLQDHAREPTPLLVRDIRWEVCADHDAACHREVDLIVALRPALNAAHAEQKGDVYVRVDDASVAVTGAIVGTAKHYGTFPHLAKRSHSSTAKLTKTGFTALLRLLWVARGDAAGRRIPPAIAGDSPPVRPVAVVAPPELHDYLRGARPRLLTVLKDRIDAAELPAFMRPALARDLATARVFYDLGPRRLHDLRRRHALDAAPVTLDVMRGCLLSELRTSIGEVRPSPQIAT